MTTLPESDPIITLSVFIYVTDQIYPLIPEGDDIPDDTEQFLTHNELHLTTIKYKQTGTFSLSSTVRYSWFWRAEVLGFLEM